MGDFLCGSRGGGSLVQAWNATLVNDLSKPSKPSLEVSKPSKPSLKEDPQKRGHERLQKRGTDTADGSPLTDRLITFKELPEGAVYYPTYVKRTIKPLLDKFADRPKSYSPPPNFGGIKADTGDFSFRLNALPRVPLTVTLWLGDEELPPEGNILFDSSITGYLPTEDITVLCEILAWKLVRLG